jgi:hypothetical protein
MNSFQEWLSFRPPPTSRNDSSSKSKGQAMRWVSGIVREPDGQLKLQVQLDATEVHLESVVDWKTDSQRTPSFEARGVDIDFKDVRRVDLRRYVEGLGETWLSINAQSGFEVAAGGKRILIPSQLMIMSLFGSAMALRSCLMAPLIANAWLTGSVSRGKATEYERRNWVGNRSAFERGEWIGANRSVCAAFGSVYRYALDGRFDMNLPSGVGTFELQGEVDGGPVLVTRMTSLAFLSREVVEDSSSNQINCHYFFDRRSDPMALVHKTPTLDDKRLRFDKAAKMTDRQWQGAKAVLAGMVEVRGVAFADAPRTWALRDCLDAIRYKFGRPCNWQDIGGDVPHAYAYQMYRSIVRAELWDQVVDAIR